MIFLHKDDDVDLAITVAHFLFKIDRRKIVIYM